MGTDIVGTQENAKLGRTGVKISGDGNRMAVSGDWYGEDGALFWGIVQVYEFDNNDWIQLGASIIGQSGDWLGSGMDFSDDGSVLLVGSRNNFTRIFSLEDGAWVQKGSDFNVDQENAKFGAIVAMSGDGKHVTFGASGYDVISDDEGYVQVYNVQDLTTSAYSFMSASLNVYPNPVRDFLIIEVSDQKMDKVRIIDQLGRVIKVFEESGQSLDLSEIPQGVFYVQILFKEGFICEKFIKL